MYVELSEIFNLNLLPPQDIDGREHERTPKSIEGRFQWTRYSARTFIEREKSPLFCFQAGKLGLFFFTALTFGPLDPFVLGTFLDADRALFDFGVYQSRVFLAAPRPGFVFAENSTQKFHSIVWYALLEITSKFSHFICVS